MPAPRLIVLSGLPGSGKSTVAEGVALALRAPILSVDPIEAAMWLGGIREHLTGVAAYGVAAAMAAEQLALGLSVVIDAVNPVEAPRAYWRDLAHTRAAVLVIIETVCSDLAEHRRRVEARRRDIPGMPELTWARVQQARDLFEPWSDFRLVLDTCEHTPEELTHRALDHIDNLSIGQP
jgi:predicted kinase